MAELVRFDKYMQECLYGEQGFYTNDSKTVGSRGSFITSPSVGPLFGTVVANWIERQWQQSGEAALRIYDVGANEGQLLKAVARSEVAQGKPWEYVTVDYQRCDLTPAEFTSENVTDSIVICNELLDNLPARIMRNGDGILEECYVDLDPNQTYKSVWKQVDCGFMPTWVKDLASEIPEGVEYPVLQSAADWVNSVMDRKPLCLLCFDYGEQTTLELATRGGWLRTYLGHKVGTDPLGVTGIDITVDIGFDQLPTPISVNTQAEFLIDNGLDELVLQAKQHLEANPSALDIEYLRLKSRVSEAQTLCDPHGLGSWMVAQWL